MYSRDGPRRSLTNTSSSASVAGDVVTSFRPIYVMGEWENDNEDKAFQYAQ